MWVFSPKSCSVGRLDLRFWLFWQSDTSLWVGTGWCAKLARVDGRVVTRPPSCMERFCFIFTLIIIVMCLFFYISTHGWSSIKSVSSCQKRRDRSPLWNPPGAACLKGMEITSSNWSQWSPTSVDFFKRWSSLSSLRRAALHCALVSLSTKIPTWVRHSHQRQRLDHRRRSAYSPK